MIALNDSPVTKVEMLIRKPVHEVFEAFIDPEITTKFWFTKSSGKLEEGTTIRWDWEMYGVHGDIHVKEIEENKRIRIEWPNPVEWTFTAKDNDETFVTIISSGYEGTGDEMVRQAIDSTEGFTIVLCGLKAFLEYGIQLNLVADKAPDAIVEGYR